MEGLARHDFCVSKIKGGFLGLRKYGLAMGAAGKFFSSLFHSLLPSVSSMTARGVVEPPL